MSDTDETPGEAPSAPPDGSRFGALITLGYVLVTITSVLNHEPWFDETHAWLIARDATVVELLRDVLRYEGHPPLWYLILMPLAKLGLPVMTANVVSASVSTIGVGVLAHASRVPLVVRLVAPFTYFIGYQYAVIARSYALLFLFLMLLAVMWGDRARRPLPFAALLGGLALVSVHGACIAVALGAWSFLERDVRSGWLARRGHLAVATGLLVIVYGGLAFALWPPDDLSFGTKLKDGLSLGGALRRGPGSLGAALMDEPLTGVIASLPIWYWLWNRGRLAFALTVQLSLWPVLILYYNRWHEGLTTLVFLFAVIVSFRHPTRPSLVIANRLGALSAVLIAGLQVFWTVKSHQLERDTVYSGAAGAAATLAKLDARDDTVFALGFPSFGLQAFFDDRIFDNYPGPHSFWRWKVDNPIYYRVSRLINADEQTTWVTRQLALEPSILVVSVKFPSDLTTVRTIEASRRYEIVSVSEGRHIWKGEQGEREDIILFSRIGRENP